MSKEYIPKWRYSKMIHDKMMSKMSKDKEARDKEALENPKPEVKKVKFRYMTIPQQEKYLLDKHKAKHRITSKSFDYDDYLYEEMVITYEELKERKAKV